ncbi:1-phosphofructokinase [Clostridium grantii]|uniref:Tagatose-6-phosphate kinase n=1 Tax=Clostridium grantii DSM 8605 TaxID=1121316 RepID=A0A1M5V2M6_9CLOT|nr:1-phosphofructokinase [Clostridium grantii]SHH69469.1 fructose-1-phosphate kinase [Clostridium grantii DSM 8605]
MIVTVTLNPALDKTMEIDDFNLEKINREKRSRVDAGGKGINVSKVIKSLGGESLATGFIAGNAGNFIKQQLDSFGIQNNFVITQGETRTNLKVVDLKNKTYTDINENGPFISEEELFNAEKKVQDSINEESVLVLSGSIPKNLSNKVYFNMITKAKEKGAKVIIDADGDLLKESIKAGPYLVKPNIDELERLYGVKLNTTDEVIECAKKLFDFGVELVVVSLGGDGSIFITREKTLIVEPIKVDVKSTVGAGDSMVAALALSLDKNYPFDEVVRLSVAAGTAAVMMEGTQAPEYEDIIRISKEVEYKYI